MSLIYNRFIAIDFETANYGRGSACAIAIVIVEKSIIINKITKLIRPPSDNFYFSYLHGIEWEDVANEPAFAQLWPKIKSFFKKIDFVAAHNASFDRSVLHTCCYNAGFTPPSVNYLCTMKLVRLLWNLYPSDLQYVCRYFNIPLNHHDATSDAVACAKIVLHALESGYDLPSKAFIKPN